MLQLFYLDVSKVDRVLHMHVAMALVVGHLLPLVRELPDQRHGPVVGHQLLRRPASQDDAVEGDGDVASRDDTAAGDGGTSVGSGGGAGVRTGGVEGARVHVKWSSRSRSPDVGTYGHGVLAIP